MRNRTGRNRPARLVPAGLLRFALAAIAWAAMTGGAPGDQAFGVLAAALAAGASLALSPPADRRWRLAGVAAVLPDFLWQSLRGGVDVAWRAFAPHPPLRPGFLDLPLALPPGPVRTTFVGAVSLMPGTLPVGTAGDRLHLHVLDASQPVDAHVARTQRRFERLLAPGKERGDG
ncbi:Na+/H+ antiporter subunit E [Arenibaculum sp.]|jgi:multicomponent Na+:H+ antiporter subunit E|uniref:Na+/H+ antiporter subunit E n=1 Tax=Arenibaculum sp. TaxID=2865862 RepID=UPI002E10E064|nr:Na+/H+ antiporter subunit E [Arenibaculum sp.]